MVLEVVCEYDENVDGRYNEKSNTQRVVESNFYVYAIVDHKTHTILPQLRETVLRSIAVAYN